MDIIRKTYLCYVAVPDEYEQIHFDHEIEVKDRDLKQVDFWSNYFSFFFYDVFETSIEVDGKTLSFRSEPTNHSPTHYFGRRLLTRKQLLNHWRKQYGKKDKNRRRELWRQWNMNKITLFIDPIDGFGLNYVRIHDSLRSEVEQNFTAIPQG